MEAISHAGATTLFKNIVHTLFMGTEFLSPLSRTQSHRELVKPVCEMEKEKREN
jgi:hypothetical protein